MPSWWWRAFAVLVFVAGMSFLGVAIGRRSASKAPAPPPLTFAEFQRKAFRTSIEHDAYVEYGTREKAVEQRKKAYVAIARARSLLN